MNAIAPGTSRRALLKGGAAAGGGLLLGMFLPGLARVAVAQDAGGPSGSGGPGTAAAGFAPNAYIRIDPAGAVTLIMPDTESGQGIWTSTAMLLAEELEVGMDQVKLQAAPPDNKLYASPLLGEQATGGSASTRADWIPLRKAGAAARTMLIQAAAQRWSVDPATCQASKAMVTHAESGRSLSYGELADEAGRQPVPKDVKLKDPATFRLIGTPQKRLDTPAKVNGTAVFGIDMKLPGLKIGTVSASPVRGGRLVSINEAAARSVPGVQDVVRLDDAYAVIGDHMWAAKMGLQAAAPVWDDGPNAGVSSASLTQALDAASRGDGVVAKQKGDPASAIKSAAKSIDVVYELPFLSHAPMEPINTTIHVRPDGADLWVGTQVPVRALMAVAHETGLPPEKIQVHNQIMGGAFGRRLDVDSITQAARIARHLDYPVKLIWTREEDIQHDLFRPFYYDRISAGLDAGGNIVGWTHKVTGSSVMARWAPPGMKEGGRLDPDAVEGAAETPYDLPAHRVEYVRAEPQGLTTAWWRGVGPTHNVFVVESVMDELASAAGKDPVSFRRGLLGHNPRALAVLDLAVSKSGWNQSLPHGRGRGVALQFAFGSYVAAVLDAEVAADGTVRIHRADVAVDCGPVVNPDTIRAQLEGGLIFGLTMALYSEITLSNGRVDQSNFHDYRMMRINEAPVVEVHVVDNPAGSIGGIGETGTAIAAPALANAIFAASGRRLRRIPFATGQLASA
ncbi:xanthine dehydrogenase family protein molybdopterin-binding subunit [Lichenicoccus roseus]|uniref:Xanthine dehydrogenase family protein molybdopterin-binding subunit n=1 Tax=Lichenicoccus roseus TaxID=2683649 RepID=A0A5R9J5H1_9PROT|nr:molybdopterin cofactor-binding domain-containing protein [Lichenicoccus roseus]TLU72802.1 xanthine dehydrogenase family protein molybdopterin-binding subunit [Lichenicoccus roseus]